MTLVQLLPLLVDKNMPPPSVPAKIFAPLMASDEILVSVKPLLTAIQLLPLLVDKNTPREVPAKMFVPLMTSDVI